MAGSRRNPSLRRCGWAALVLMLIMISALMVETIYVFNQYEALQEEGQIYLTCQSSVRDMAHASDYLMRESRVFVETLELSRMKAYFEEVNVARRREQALEAVEAIGGFMEEELNKAYISSKQLEEREIYAMRLVCDGAGIPQADRAVEIQNCVLNAADEQLSAAEKRTRGEWMLFDKAYEDMKDTIDNWTDGSWNKVLDCIQAQRTATDALLKRLFMLLKILIPALIVLMVLMLLKFEIRVCRPLRKAADLVGQQERLPEQGYKEFKQLFALYNTHMVDWKRGKSALERAVEMDGLTGLVNQTAFGRVVMYLQKSGAPLALLLLRVDRFQLLSEEKGREPANEVVCRLAAMVPQQFRPYDTVFRLEEDVFGILMVDVTPVEGKNIQRRVRKLNEALAEQKDLPSCTISAGLAFSPRGYTEEMRQQAQEALDQARDTGDCVMAKE